MNGYISGLILESKDHYNHTAYLKGVFLNSWNNDEEDLITNFNSFFNELSNTILTQQESVDRIRMMALYVICQFTGVLICKGGNEAEMNNDLMSYFYEIDKAESAEEILEKLKITCLHIIDYQINLNCAKKTSKLIFNIITYINNHIDEKLSLQSVCKELNYSPSYVSHEFKKEMQMTFTDYLHKKKLEKAKELMSSGHSIDEVSNYLCFSSTSHFISFFKRYMNITPKQFAKWLSHY